MAIIVTSPFIYFYNSDQYKILAVIVNKSSTKNLLLLKIYQQLIGSDSCLTDDGGHLAASIFDSVGEQINYIPLNCNLNRSIWKK